MATAAPQNCDKDGSEGKLYWNNGTCETPVWCEHLGLQGDLNDTAPRDKNLLPGRGGGEFKEYTLGKADLEITGALLPDFEYIGNVKFHEAHGEKKTIDLLYLTGPLDSGEKEVGYRGEFVVPSLDRNNPSEGAMEVPFSLAPAACSGCPVRIVETTGTGASEASYVDAEVLAADATRTMTIPADFTGNATPSGSFAVTVKAGTAPTITDGASLSAAITAGTIILIGPTAGGLTDLYGDYNN